MTKYDDKYTNLKISVELNKVLDLIKKETGANKIFTVEKAVREVYSEYFKKEEK